MTAEKNIKGLLGRKLGMTQVFDENNRVVPVTVVQAGPNVITQIRTSERDVYTAVQIAYGAIDPRKVNKPVTGQFTKAGVTGLAQVAGRSLLTVRQRLTLDVRYVAHQTVLLDLRIMWRTVLVVLLGKGAF